MIEAVSSVVLSAIKIDYDFMNTEMSKSDLLKRALIADIGEKLRMSPSSTFDGILDETLSKADDDVNKAINNLYRQLSIRWHARQIGEADRP